jgi:hypothetical protein
LMELRGFEESAELEFGRRHVLLGCLRPGLQHQKCV